MQPHLSHRSKNFALRSETLGVWVSAIVPLRWFMAFCFPKVPQLSPMISSPSGCTSPLIISV
jgi:hypothetical protein